VYGALWQRLPGPWPVKLLESAALVVGVTALLFVVVFPWLEPRLPFTDVTVDEEESGADIVDEDNPDPSVVDPSAPAPADPNNPALGRGPASVDGLIGATR
jgi:hypothetical protein